jgi:hypothetical protein
VSNPDIRPAQSLEFVRVAVGASEAGVSVDPTGDAVSLAFITEGSSVDGSTAFTAATWETDASDPDNPVFYARVLVGPSGSYVPVANTAVDIYVRVSDNPEIPIRKSGTLRFT